MGTTRYLFDDTAQSDWTLGGITFLTTPIWADQFNTSLAKGTEFPLLDGTTATQLSVRNVDGLPVTLELTGNEGCLTAEQASDLKDLVDTGDVISFSTGAGGETFDVVFDYTRENPLDIRPFDGNRVLYVGTIYLKRVASS